MARRMAEDKFRNQQWEKRYDKHIAKINQFVDELRRDERGWAPYIAPMYGGVQARLLSILRDPGPKTQDDSGSGFLCMENDDPTAERISGLFAEADIKAHDIVPWNAYPWYINRAPNAVELNAGTEPLKRVVDLMPKLSVVMLHGGEAKNGCKKFIRQYPNLVAERELHVIETYHTSRQAFWHVDPAVREYRKNHLHESFAEAARHLNAGR